MYEFLSLRQNNLKLQKILINNIHCKSQEQHPEHLKPFIQIKNDFIFYSCLQLPDE